MKYNFDDPFVVKLVYSIHKDCKEVIYKFESVYYDSYRKLNIFGYVRDIASLTGNLTVMEIWMNDKIIWDIPSKTFNDDWIEAEIIFNLSHHDQHVA